MPPSPKCTGAGDWRSHCRWFDSAPGAPDKIPDHEERYSERRRRCTCRASAPAAMCETPPKSASQSFLQKRGRLNSNVLPRKPAQKHHRGSAVVPFSESHSYAAIAHGKRRLNNVLAGTAGWIRTTDLLIHSKRSPKFLK